jgi:hypothetical protein
MSGECVCVCVCVCVCRDAIVGSSISGKLAGLTVYMLFSDAEHGRDLTCPTRVLLWSDHEKNIAYDFRYHKS